MRECTQAPLLPAVHMLDEGSVARLSTSEQAGTGHSRDQRRDRTRRFQAARRSWCRSASISPSTVPPRPQPTRSARRGSRRMLVAGTGLMIFSGVLFAATHSSWLLLVAATVGVISPSGNEVGPFLAIEPAALSEKTPGDRRTRLFTWYNLGSFATALGALAGGGLAQALQGRGFTPFGSYRVVVVGYAVIGAAMVLLFLGTLCRGVGGQVVEIASRRFLSS